MNEQKTNQNEEMQIDLQRLISALLSKAWLIVLVAVIGALLAFLYTYFFVTPLYKSTAKFYVNNNSLASLSEATIDRVSTADISASRGLVKTYIVILNTRETLNDVIDYAGVDCTYGRLKGMISASDVDSTEIFQVVVTSPDPYEAERLANAIAYVLPNRIKDIIDGTSAKVVEAAVVATGPSSPNYTTNTMKGFVIGMVLMAVVVILQNLLDITVRSEEDISRSGDYPVLASVPDMEVQSVGGYYYGYGSKKKSSEKGGPKTKRRTELIGGNICFAAAEAYKLLRTKLQFSFVDEKNCRVIGISSALTGEGKSLSAVNLAYTMSQLGKNVLLIDCDMRRPSMAEKLPVRKYPGLSDFLTGQIGGDELIQLCGIKDEETAFHAISSGRTPPNPMELLSSVRMEKMLLELREKYDYIILDLPPVGEVSDALVAARYTDGVLMVVRQNYCDRVALNAALRQFLFVDAKILGVVFNCIREENGGRYYKRYYKRYYHGYYKKSYDPGRKANLPGEK